MVEDDGVPVTFNFPRGLVFGEWSRPYQLRFREIDGKNVLEMRPLRRQGGLSGAYYIDDGEE